jgi:Leucine-rich repeat (LRR) protein
LDVRGTRVSDGTLEIVSRLTGLEALDIAHTEVTDFGLDYLVPLVNLKELSVGRGRLSNSGLVALRMLPTLTYLDLSGAKATPPDSAVSRAGSGMPEETLKAIAELKDLRTLYLGFSAINADGLRTLGSLDKVEKLGVQGCSRFDDAALAELAKWKSLKYLDVQETPVTENGLAELRKAKPAVKIISGGTLPPPPAPYNR